MENTKKYIDDLYLPNDNNLCVKRITDTSKLPTKERDSDEGYDIYSDEDITIPNGQTRKISTGIISYVSSNGNHWLQVESRSGLSCKGLFVIGGIVDSSYRGEIGVIMANLSGEDYDIKQGNKIAQMVIRSHKTMPIKEVQEVSVGERGTNGFGSSGL